MQVLEEKKKGHFFTQVFSNYYAGTFVLENVEKSVTFLHPCECSLRLMDF